MSRSWWLLTVLMVVGLVATVSAQPPGGGRPGGGQRQFSPENMVDRMFERWDANSDGKITRDEMTSAMEQARTQRQEARPQGERGARQERQGDRGPNRFQEAMLERLKERLGASDDEWKVLEPRIQKVLELRAGAGGGFGMMRGGFGTRPGGGQGAPTEVTALNDAVEKENVSADTLKKRLEEYRKAVAEREAKLKAARDELRGLVTVRQEAILVLSGILE